MAPHADQRLRDGAMVRVVDVTGNNVCILAVRDDSRRAHEQRHGTEPAGDHTG